MKRLPDTPDLGHLKRQAKDLIAAYRAATPEAVERFRQSLPAAAGRPDAAVLAMGLRLHDAQSCLAREYGFRSWAELATHVEARRLALADPKARKRRFLSLVYAGDLAGGMDKSRPHLAQDLLAAYPDLTDGDPYMACAVGDTAAVQRHIATDASWVHRAGGPLNLPPLVAVTHSGLLQVPAVRDRLHAIARVLLDAGADPNQSVGSRWPPASLDAPSPEHPLSALYGAAGQNHDPVLTRLLLDAGADPNDGESLYHSLEKPECTRLLLDAGAVVTGTNALFRTLDLDDVDTLRLLLAHARGVGELSGGDLLFWAIRRRRSVAHIQALLDAGVDPSARTKDGLSPHTLASLYGLVDVADLLAKVGAAEALSDEDRFVAACARADRRAAQQIRTTRPDLPKSLSERQLRQLPELAAAGCADAVMVMVEMGWPIAVRGGDWKASALNHGVFRGDAALVRFLLEHGATWTEEHGFGDNACGTLSWASINQPEAGGDWVGCAQALVDHGMPPAQYDADGGISVGGTSREFSEEVTDVLLEAGVRAVGP